MKRFMTNPRKDKKIFSKSAAKTKAINLPARIFRGGIRM